MSTIKQLTMIAGSIAGLLLAAGCTPQYTRQIVADAMAETPFAQSLQFTRSSDWIIPASANLLVAFPVSEHPSAVNHQVHEAFYEALAYRHHRVLHYWQADALRNVLDYARQMQVSFVIVPEVLAYTDGVNSVDEYRADSRPETEWTRDRVVIKLLMYDAATGNPLDTATVELDNPVFHLSTQHPSELLTRAANAYVDAISR
jgi:hypothetical protein